MPSRLAVVWFTLLALFAPAQAHAALPGAKISATETIPHVAYPGMRTLHFEYGPIKIAPGRTRSR
jgi:hypothetical protein